MRPIEYGAGLALEPLRQQYCAFVCNELIGILFRFQNILTPILTSTEEQGENRFVSEHLDVFDFTTEDVSMLIDLSVAFGSVSLLVCSLICVAAIRSGQVRRKLRAFVRGRVLDF